MDPAGGDATDGVSLIPGQADPRADPIAARGSRTAATVAARHGGRAYRTPVYDKGFAKVFTGRSAQLNGITMEPRAL